MKITKKDGIYIEDSHKMKAVRLSNRDYAKATEAMIGVCADAIIINKSKRTFFLPRRIVKPMKGWWSIGGRRMPGESSKEALVRNFERETSLKINPKRFKFVSIQEVIWKNRKEKPEDVGKHDLIYFFRIELAPKERSTASANLDHNEYEKGFTIFDRKNMLTKKVHPALLTNYDLIFKARQ